MKLSFFDSRKLNSKRYEMDKIIDSLIEMPDNKVAEIKGNASRLSTLKQRLYHEHKGKFQITTKTDHLLIRKKNE